MKESPIFIKAYETMVWVLQHTRKFPKEQRFLMARRLEDGFLNFYEHLNQAVKIKCQAKDYATGNTSWSQIATSLQAWNVHASLGDTWRLRGDIFRKNTFRINEAPS
ncbi:MAG: hypothetical protein JXR76_14515 [Deltaproteobacteria bacterium]|nr:hypothetical protein [Deltaproteobacteria bacterium]